MALIRISNGPEEVGRAQFSLAQYLHCRCIQHTYISTSGLRMMLDQRSAQFMAHTYISTLGLRISNGPEEVGRAQFSLTQYLHCTVELQQIFDYNNFAHII